MPEQTNIQKKKLTKCKATRQKLRRESAYTI